MPLSHHLQKLVPKETRHLAKPKTAKDVIPSLWAAGSTSRTSAEAATAATTTEPSFELHPEVLQYLQQQQQKRGTQGAETIPAKLSSRQLRILQSLLQPMGEQQQQQQQQQDGGDEVCKVRRALLESAPHAMTHLLAIASLQLQQLHLTSTNTNGHVLFVLVEDEANASEMKRVCENLYGMQVLLLNGEDKFPQFSLSSGATSTEQQQQQQQDETTTGAPAKNKKKKKVETSPKSASPLAGTSIMISTVSHFLATDKRSAIWKYVYAFVVALLPSTEKKQNQKQSEAPDDVYALLSTIKQDSSSTKSKDSVYKQLVDHRWDCLGHCTLALVLATTTEGAKSMDSKAASALLYHPLLQFINCTASEPSAATTTTSTTSKTPTKKEKEEQQGEVSASAPTVYYHPLEGKDRLLFLFALIKNLQKGKGLVVHVATKEMCYFVYNVVFYFLYHSPRDAPGSATSNDYGLPSYIRLLSDFEGEGNFSFSVREEMDKQRLVREFDGIIDAFHNAEASKTTSRKKEVSAVLISCHALVPARGSIFIQYDCIPNIKRFNAFVCQQLSSLPTTSNSSSSSSGAADKQGLTYAVRKRGRSTSPTPTPKSQTKKASEEEVSTVSSGVGGVHYPFIFLLTRPHETKALLQQLAEGPAGRSVHYKPMSTPPSLKGQFFFLAEDIVEANKQVFLLHNAAFNAYRNTMRVYCTLPPYKQLYESLVEGNQRPNKAAAELSDKELVSQFQKNYHKFDWVKKIAEEFGFTEMPLLDLRVKKNEFRPTEDLYGAARKIARIEARKYNAFAKEHILPEVDSD